MLERGAVAALAAFVLLGWSGPAGAQGGMPDPREMSGVPLPVTDLPAGTLSVRVVRTTFDNVAGADVVFDVDGRARSVTTNEDGRAEVSGLAQGTRVRASVVVDGERIESQSIVIGATGLRVMLVAAPAGSAVPGDVVLSSESRVIAEMQDDRLSIFYILDVVNASAGPVDLGGPLVFELPREARGTTVLQGSTPQATANGPRVTVTSPFAPGRTPVQIAYEMPYRGATVRIDQVWPATLQQVNLLVEQTGGLTVFSPQLSQSREIVDQGQPLIIGMGPAIEAGRSLVLEIGGLPHHPIWPRNVALALAGSIVVIGIWAAMFPGTPPAARRRRG